VTDPILDPDAPTTSAQEAALAAVPLLGARDAAALALRRLLEDRFLGVVGGGAGASARPVRLRRVFDAFPTTLDRAEYPCASIADVGRQDDDDFDPTWDDDGWDADEGAALMTMEVTGSFAVDLWASDPLERKALKAALPRCFRDGASASGSGGRTVHAPYPEDALPPAFASRASALRIRLTLDASPEDMDEDVGAQESEFRAGARVTWEAVAVSAERIAPVGEVMQSGDVVALGTFDREVEEAVADGRAEERSAAK